MAAERLVYAARLAAKFARVALYANYFNRARAHQGLNQATAMALATAACGNVIGLPVLGGLHHDYRRAA